MNSFGGFCTYSPHHSFPYRHTSICLSYSLHSFRRYISIPIRSERDAGSRQEQTSSAERSSPYAAAKPNRLNGLPPPERTDQQLYRSCFSFMRILPDLHSVPYIQRFEQICNRCFLLSFIL